MKIASTVEQQIETSAATGDGCGRRGKGQRNPAGHFQNLKEESLRKQLAAHYGLRNMDVFWNWMNTIRVVRNLCAHGHNLYDLRLQKSIKKGPLGDSIKSEMLHTLQGVLCVVFYLLQQVSVNRQVELRAHLRQLLLRPEVNSVRGALSYLKEMLCSSLK